MERLNALLPQPQHLGTHPSQDAAKRILLLDCDSRRRGVRAEALMNHGILVDRAAETVVARTLWKPRTYDLVLIDLRGADADCAAFIAFVQSECVQQKFGFYIAQSPYLTASAAECRSSLEEPTLQPLAADRQSSGQPTRTPDGTGLVVASQRIAAAKQLARIRAQAPEPHATAVPEPPSRGHSSSDALRLAERVLGSS